MHFIETVKFTDFINHLDFHNPLHRWLTFLKSDDKSLLEEVISMDKNIAEAEERLSALNLSKELREAYDARERELHDEVTRMRGAKEEGKKEIIEAMRKNGFTDEDIKKITGVDPRELH
ncbi:PD-(D/E)XK nuclease family transposase [Lederbergia ruris]|uniref:PD-(D/E)XK nuclease family transposase n=1 Tax=Lederbergia ruris TaxID=217495 RepID=UPI002484C9DB|nr:PD-(D/E)XK nuclease family transposase [Lederbergia ruris]